MGTEITNGHGDGAETDRMPEDAVTARLPTEARGNEAQRRADAGAKENGGPSIDSSVLPWSASQRRALAALFIIAAGALLVRARSNPTIIGDPPPDRGPRSDQLADRLDPNVATVGELAAIPLLGEKRAGEIVAYRQAFEASHPKQRAFAQPEDLMRVKGIGPATVETLEGYLYFPDGGGIGH